MKARPPFFKPAHSRVCRSGFTMLELVIVLFIMALFLGVAAYSFQGINEEEILRTPASELQRMAREAVRRAGMYEQPETIVFEKNGFGIRFRDDAAALTGGTASAHWLRRVQTPADMVLQIKRWGQKEWQPAAGQRWIVQPSGLCEPLSVRLTRGRAYLEMQFNPLTGGVADEHMMIPP